MDIIKIRIKSVGKDIAEATAKILKQNTKFRQLFVPQLIDNPNDKNKSIRARIITQRKKPSEDWEDFNEIKQTDLKSGEWLSLDIDSDSLDIILAYCNELNRIYEEEGKGKVFNTKRTIILGKSNDKEDVDKLLELLKENPNASMILEKLSSKNIETSDLIKFLDQDKEKIKDVIMGVTEESKNELYNNLSVNFIKTDYLKSQLNNNDEEFWQNLFEKNPRIITSVIPSVLTFICSKPYVGGKAIDNKGGVYSDYILGCGPSNICLIEIKTPCTSLLKTTEYRKGVYAPSDELSGAIVQLRKQKDNFTKEYYTLSGNNPEEYKFKMYDPKCYLIIGSNEDFSKEQAQSFELFRKELKDIEIITYTELIKKLDLIVQSLAN